MSPTYISPRKGVLGAWRILPGESVLVSTDVSFKICHIISILEGLCQVPNLLLQPQLISQLNVPLLYPR